MPTTIVGANVQAKANFITIAYCGIVQHKPAMIAVASGKIHYTNNGIKENQTFSVNIPCEDMAVITDYIGMKSGREIDKSQLFEVFYGELKTAPMIKEAPLNLECRLVETLDFGGMNEIFIGEIIQTYAFEDILTSGLPDIKKFKPILFSMHDKNYWKVGEHLGKAWDIGRNFKK
jgi:flavin reductase (DIM6/NTAB) family NADH-FMN oxidoreductase RutF